MAASWNYEGPGYQPLKQVGNATLFVGKRVTILPPLSNNELGS
jgi:hypothetical protein